MNLIILDTPYTCHQPPYLFLCQSFTFIILSYKFCYPWIPIPVLEKLSSKLAQGQKVVEDWRRPRNKRDSRHSATGDFRTKERESEGREIILGMLLKLLVKDKLLHSGKYLWTRSWDAWGERNEEWKFSNTALWTRQWRCDGIAFNFYTELPHIYFLVRNFFHACPFIAQE